MLYFYTVDTETTGLKAGFNEIIQMSLVRHADDIQVSKNIKANHPERASREALQIQGKSFYDLKDGESHIECAKYFSDFLEEDGATPKHRCIIGHNVSFDRRFIHSTWESANKIFPADLWLDTKEFGRKYAKKIGIEKPKLSLANCLEMTNLKPRFGAHNAIIDSLNTVDLFRFLMNENLNHLTLIKSVPHQ